MPAYMASGSLLGWLGVSKASSNKPPIAVLVQGSSSLGITSHPSAQLTQAITAPVSIVTAGVKAIIVRLSAPNYLTQLFSRTA